MGCGHGEEQSRHRRRGYRRNDEGETVRQEIKEGNEIEDAGQRHRQADREEHAPLPSRGRDDDGDEHPVEHESEATPHHFGEKCPRQSAQEGACRPADIGDTAQARKVVHPHLLLFGGGHREDLVGDAEGQKHPPGGGEATVQPLGQGDAHEGVAQIDDQLGQNHGDDALGQGEAVCDEIQPRLLTGRGLVGHGDDEGDEGRQPRRHCRDADAEGDRQVPEADGHAVPQSLAEGVCLLFHDSFVYVPFY